MSWLVHLDDMNFRLAGLDNDGRLFAPLAIGRVSHGGGCEDSNNEQDRHHSTPHDITASHKNSIRVSFANTSFTIRADEVSTTNGCIPSLRRCGTVFTNPTRK